MPWIQVIRESEAEGEIKAAYDRMAELGREMGSPWASRGRGRTAR